MTRCACGRPIVGSRARCAVCQQARDQQLARARQQVRARTCACPCGCRNEFLAAHPRTKRCAACREQHTWMRLDRACLACGRWATTGSYCRACARAIGYEEPTSIAERIARDAATCQRREPRPSGPVRRAVYERAEFDVMWDGT